MKRLLLLIVLVCVMGKLEAQELWLRPSTYFIEGNQKTPIQIIRGENFVGKAVQLQKEAISEIRYRDQQPSPSDSVFREKNGQTILVIPPLPEGTSVFFVKTTPMQVQKDSEAFAGLLEQYGHDHLKEETAQGISTMMVTHYLNLLIQYGKERTEMSKAPVGYPVEIIPLVNPYRLKKGDPIMFTVYRDGKPAFGVRVKIWNRNNNRTTIQNIYTEKDGTINTHISSAGDWMVSVMNVEQEAGGLEGEVYTLLFGYR